MTRDQIIQWAREAELAESRDDASTLPTDYVAALERFAQLARAALSKGPATLTDEQIRLPDPFCYLCDWGDYGGLPRQIVYFGEPGSGVDDDWNEVPKVHHNKPMYTEEQVRAIIAKVKGVE